jgi:hypothetical protein
MSSTALSTFLPAFSIGPSFSQPATPAIGVIIASTAMNRLPLFHHVRLLVRME